MLKTAVDRTYARLLAMAILWLSLLLSVVVYSSAQVIAATNSELNFQARLQTSVGQLVPDGDYHVEFKLYDDQATGSLLWTETYTGVDVVEVRNGYLTVQLGSLTTFPSSIDWSQELWLTLNVGGSGGVASWDGEMSPRLKLTAVPYAFRAGELQGANGAVTADDLVQLAPSNIQTISEALSALRLNQTGSGGLLQLQGDGADVFSVDKTGATTLGAGLTLGNSSALTPGTLRWTGTDFEGYDGSQWVSLTQGAGGGALSFDSFYAYDAIGDIDISAGWTDITLDTEVREDTPYTHNVDGAEVTINEDGWYEISYNISTYSTTGGNAQASTQAKLQADTGGGFADIPGSYGYMFLRSGGADANAAATVTRQFVAGDIVKLQAQRASGTLTTLTRANSVGLTIRKFIEVDAGGGPTNAFEQSGNAFGVAAVLGTTDTQALNFITNNITRLTIAANGDISTTSAVSTGPLTTNGDLTIATTNSLILDGQTFDSLLGQGLTLVGGDLSVDYDQLDNDFLRIGGNTLASALTFGTNSNVALNFETNGNTRAVFEADGDFAVDNNTLFVDAANNAVGIGTVTPNEALQVVGGINIGNTGSANAGTIRWTGTDFEGYNGSSWVSLTLGSGGGGGGSTLEGILAFGKVQGSTGNALDIDGASVVRNSIGDYSVTLTTSASQADYTILVSFTDSSPATNDITISISNQSASGFDIDIYQGNTRVDRDWHFTVFDPDATAGGLSGTAGGDLQGTYPNPTIAPDAVALGIDTTGIYVDSILAGSGIAVNNAGTEDIESTISLGVLSEDWMQTGAFNIVLSNANSGLRILESSGSTFYGSLDVGDLTADRTITIGDESGTICIQNSPACGFILLGPATAQTESSNNNSIFINKTSATGNLLELQRDGNGVFTIFNSGALRLSVTSTSALTVRNAGGTEYFNIDTSGAVVRVGASTGDATAVLFALDVKNTAGDPTGFDGAQYYNSNLGKFRCYENGSWRDCLTSPIPSIRSFIDSTSDPLIDANTTNYWDASAENNNSTPNLTLSAASGVAIYGTVTLELTSNTNQDVEATARVERGIGSPPTCGSGTQVGGLPGIFATNIGAIKSSTITFVDVPNTTNTVYYTVCSDAATAGNTSANITRIRVTLQEVENSN